MPELLRSLTTRGWSFLAAGVVVIVCAVLSGHDTLVRLGVLATALPLLAVWWVHRSREQLTLSRTVSPQVLPVGKSATVRLTVTNQARTGAGTLLLEERLPYALGQRPRFILEALAPGRSRHATYTVRSDVRGQFDLGPMAVRTTDPFGLVDLGNAFTSVGRLTVTPRVFPLTPIPLGGAWTGSGDNRPKAFASGSAEDVTVREYRLGDDLRRVHWHSSARTGELMVRREEQPWQSRATVYLDNRASAHQGQGPASSLETAVSAAASVVMHLAGQGYTVRLVTAAGDNHETQWHSHAAAASTAPLLEALAVVQPVHLAMPDTQWMAESTQGEVTIGVFGALSDSDAPFLRRLHHHSVTGMALVLDVASWVPHGPTGPDTQTAALMTGSGWSFVTVGPRDRLDSRWQDLAKLQLRVAP